MGLFNKSYEAVQVDSSLRQRVNSSRPDGKAIKVRPHPENGNSLSASEELLNTLYQTINTSLFGYLNTSGISTFEIWYDDGEIQFYFFVKDEETRKRLLKQIGGFFENADVKEVEKHFPSVEEGEWISGGRFHLKKHYFAPIRHPGGQRDMDYDPYQSITNDMTAKSETRMVLQVAMKPAVSDWTSAVTKDVGEYGESMRKDETVTILKGLSWEDYEVSPPKHVRQAAEDIIEQKGKPAFHINLRMLSIGPTEEKAIQQCKDVGGIYRQTHEEVTGQTLVPRPQEKNEILELVDDMCLRNGRYMNIPSNPVTMFTRKLNRYFRGTCETIIMTMPEVAALAHIPDKSINNNSVEWHRLSVDGTIPPNASEFEDLHGGTPDDPRRNGEELAENTLDAADEDFVSEWEGEDEEEDTDDLDGLLEDSMDDPMDEYVE